MPKKLTFADGTITTRGALHEQVQLLEPGVVRIIEPVLGTVETLEVLGERADALGADFDTYVLVMDLTHVGKDPSADYRVGIVRWMRSLGCIHTCYVQPGNIIARVALRFMMSRARTSVSVHKTLSEALDRARSKLA